MTKNWLKPPIELRRKYKDAEHRRKVRELPCLACEAEDLHQVYPSLGHHKMGEGGGGKVSDLLMMTLCSLHHNGEFVRDEDKDKVSTWSIHKSNLKNWEKRWGTQDNLIKKTNKKIKNND